MTEERKEDFTYKVKCRNCNKINEMYYGSGNHDEYRDFKYWISERSNFPIQMQCKCDNDSVMLHDIISYKFNP